LIRDLETITAIDTIGVNQEIAKMIEDAILEEITETTPIRNLSCLSHFPKVNYPWTEWLLYSIINKWGEYLEVGLSSNQLRQSIPLVAPKGKLNLSSFKNVSVAPVRIAVDDMSDIDKLLEDIISVDMLEDME
jgi:hypothetical protein